MSSRDVFIRNVRELLSRRGLRLKDLSEGTGISLSHLSLVLNGMRSLSDDMKDKIAAFLGVSLSRLYSEEPAPADAQAATPERDPERTELRHVVDSFLHATNMDELRRSFYLALGTLSDSEARSVKGFLMEILRDIAASERETSGFEPHLGLSRDEQKLLALYLVARSGARLEWVRAASGLSDQAFEMLTEKLCSRSLISLIEDNGGVRVRVHDSACIPGLSLLFTRERQQAIFLTLAQAMEALPDDGPFFQSNLAEVLLKAGATRKSIACFEQAARLFEAASLVENAAECWYKAALLSHLVFGDNEKYWKLCEAVRCIVVAGRREDAEAIAYSMLEELDARGLGHLKGKVCLLTGHALLKKHPLEALSWYRRGLAAAPVNSYIHGALLGSALGSLLDLRQIDEAEDVAKSLDRWLLQAKVSDEQKKYIAGNYELLRAIVYYWKRDWRSAKEQFLKYLATDGCPEPQRATAMYNLALILYREGRLDEARRYIEEAVGKSAFAEFGANRAHANVELAKIHLRAGELEPIAKLVEEAERILDSRPTAERGWVWLIRAAVSKHRGLYREPVAAAKRAIELFSKFGAEREEACGCLWLASLLNEKGDSMSDYYEHRAYAIYEKRGWDPKDLLDDVALLKPLKN